MLTFEATHEIWRPTKGMVLGFGAAVLLPVLMVLNSGSSRYAIAIAAGVAVVVLFYTARFALNNRTWLLGLLVLEEVLPYANIIPYDPQARWMFRYPLLLALCVPTLPSTWRSGILWQGGFRMLMAFYLWGAVTVTYSLLPGISAGRLLPAVLLFAALSSVVFEVQNRDDVQLILGRFLCCCGLVMLMEVAAFIALPAELSWTHDEAAPPRFGGVFNTPNLLGQLMLATVASGLLYWPNAAGWRKLGATFAIVSSVVFAVMADSRSGFAAMAVGGLLWLLWRYRARGAIAAAGLSLLAVMVFALASPSARVYISGRDTVTLTGRTEAWAFEVKAIAERPLVGYGYDVEGEIFQNRYFTSWQEFWNQGANSSLHNGYLAIAVGMGTPALLLWLFAVIRPFVYLFRNSFDPWNLRPVALLVVVPILLLGIDESPLDPLRYPKGLLLTLCWGLAERQRLLTIARKREAATIAESSSELLTAIASSNG